MPRIDEESESPAASSSRTSVTTGWETILLVDDNDPVRIAFGTILQTYGYKVLQASHAQEALEVSHKYDGPIQLLVTDVVMPQMSGRELAIRLQPERPHLKVLYMSGYMEEALRQDTEEEKLAFLQKPISAQTLIHKIRELLDAPPAT